MNAPMAANDLNLMKFGIGAARAAAGRPDPAARRRPLHRRHEPRPTGHWCVMVRSQVAHGVIKGIDTAEAKTMPGVLGVWTGADLAAYGPLKTLIPVPNRDGSPMKMPTRSARSPPTRCVFVGDPVAFVVAETLAEAKDAAEAVDGRHRRRCPPSPMRARPPSPARRWCSTRRPATSASTISMATAPRWPRPSPRPRTSRGLRLVNNRIVVCAMEPRSAPRRLRRQDRPLHPARRQPGCVRPEASDGRPARRSSPTRCAC